MKKRGYIRLCLIILSLIFWGAGNIFATNAPGGPGADPIWNYAGNTGIGSSYERYYQGGYSDSGETGKISRVWFTIAKGIVTETAYPRIDKAQISSLPGALIASLSIPWGDTISAKDSATGYRAVWPRDFYQCASALLKNGGYVDIDWNKRQITPPKTQQERWEEQEGYSPSTVAATISGLVCAADMAEHAGEASDASDYLAKADEYEGSIESRMFTTNGRYGDGQYFLRITPDENANNGSLIKDYNGALNDENENAILDAGFLELVRYGVRGAKHASIEESIEELDDTGINDKYRVRYSFSFDNKTYPGWRRYGCDGYGERTDNGGNFTGANSNNRGRVWPFFTGERGHYELERLKSEKGDNLTQQDIDGLRDTYVRAMEYFANEGLMIPEQIWDGIGVNSQGFIKGEGTNSATPLAWSHAEYVKLVRSLHDRSIWYSYSIVKERYLNTHGKVYPHVYFRGTSNLWETTAMDLVDDHIWEIVAPFADTSNERFKFDIYGDWSLNFGDNDLDGIADQNGKDIPVKEGAGEYTITFNYSTKAYTIKKNSTVNPVFRFFISLWRRLTGGAP